MRQRLIIYADVFDVWRQLLLPVQIFFVTLEHSIGRNFTTNSTIKAEAFLDNLKQSSLVVCGLD